MSGAMRSLLASWLSSLSSNTDPPRRLFVPTNVAVVVFLACIAVIAAAMIVLRYRISRHWIDLRTTRMGDTNENQGQTVIVTGGNTGLGYQVAYDLAVRRRFGTVVLGCRNVQQGRQAADEITRRAKAAIAADPLSPSQEASAAASPRVVCVHLDLASLASVAQFAHEVKSTYRNIHALVLNAGVWVPMNKGWKTTDGYEIHFGVNHLGHQLLEQQQPGMSGSRIVWVTSFLLQHGQVRVVEGGTNDFVRTGRTATAVASEDTKNLGSEESKAGKAAARTTKKSPPSYAPTGYCDSKLMNALACRQLATEVSLASHRSTAVTTYAVCPGFCRTELGRYDDFPRWMKLLLTPLMWAIQRPAEVGAQNIVYCCLEDSHKLVNGGLYRDGQIMREGGCADLVDRLVQDGTADKLWNLCSSLLKDYLKETK